MLTDSQVIAAPRQRGVEGQVDRVEGLGEGGQSPGAEGRGYRESMKPHKIRITDILGAKTEC